MANKTLIPEVITQRKAKRTSIIIHIIMILMLLIPILHSKEEDPPRFKEVITIDFKDSFEKKIEKQVEMSEKAAAERSSAEEGSPPKTEDPTPVEEVQETTPEPEPVEETPEVVEEPEEDTQDEDTSEVPEEKDTEVAAAAAEKAAAEKLITDQRNAIKLQKEKEDAEKRKEEALERIKKAEEVSKKRAAEEAERREEAKRKKAAEAKRKADAKKSADAAAKRKATEAKKKADAAAKKKAAEAEKARAAAEAAKQGSGNGSGGSGSGNGKSNTPGEGKQGSSDRGNSDTDGKADSGAEGVDFDGIGKLQRGVNKRVFPKDLSKSGKVVFNICINREGTVVYAKYNRSKSTLTDRSAVSDALTAMKKTSFHRDGSASSKECGQWTINFTALDN